MLPIASTGRWPEDLAVWALSIPRLNDHRALPAAWLDVLDAEEWRRVAAYRREIDKIRFAAARANVRYLLADHLDLPPATLRFEANERGRPSLIGQPSLSFNVSHSGQRALIALSPLRTVGIDIEKIEASLDWRGLMPMTCTAQEGAWIEGAPEARRLACFMRCWTAKEALLKALGKGIAEDLKAIEVDPLANGLQQCACDAPALEREASALRFHWLDDFAGGMSLASMASGGLQQEGSAAEEEVYQGCLAYGPEWTRLG